MREKYRRWLKLFVHKLLPIACLVAILFIFAKIIVFSKRFMDETKLTPGALLRLAFNTGVDLKETNGRTNVLVLGIAGGKHAGADLTDTLIVLSVDVHKKTMGLISIPRDIWSDTLKDKVNSSYHYGEEKKTGGGLVLSKVTIEDVVGIPIHYVLLIDFSGFKDIIDAVGGIDVNVPRAFVDPEFPIEGKENDTCDGDPTFACRYEALSFTAGTVHMDGSLALKYVRSRHAEGEEGGDFARSRRQQDMLVALKQKLLSFDVFVSLRRMQFLLEAFDRATQTDLKIGELATLGKAVAKTSEQNITRISLEDFLTEPPLWMYGRYVLVPKESWDTVHKFIRSQLD